MIEVIHSRSKINSELGRLNQRNVGLAKCPTTSSIRGSQRQSASFTLIKDRMAKGSYSLRRWPIQRQLNRKRRSLADHAFNPNPSVVLLDDLAAHAQAEAGATVALLIRILGRVEGLEDTAELIGRDADPTVGNPNFHHMRCQILANVDPQTSTIEHRLTGINDQVQENLLDLTGNDLCDGPTVVALFNVNAMLGEVFFGKKQHFIDQLSNVGCLPASRLVAGKTQHPADNGRTRWPPLRIFSNACFWAGSRLPRMPSFA